jgi:hypothetical protein
MRRLALWVVVFAVVVTAGCSSLAGDDGATADSSTVTAVPIQTPQSTPAPSTVAPGLATDRIVDYTALVENHGRVINGTAHTYRRNVTRRYANGTVWRTYSTVVERNGSTLRYRYNWTTAASTGSGQVIDRWTSGDRTYVARTDGNRTTYAVENATAGGGPVLGTRSGYAASLPQFLQRLEVTVAGTESRNGQRLYRLETPEPKALPPSRNVTFVGYVTPDGVFTEYRLTYDVVRRDTSIGVTVAASFEGIGSTTVSRPEWVDRVPESERPE